jgi:hypothetical protein
MFRHPQLPLSDFQNTKLTDFQDREDRIKRWYADIKDFENPHKDQEIDSSVGML